jgi:hypothetical protein
MENLKFRSILLVCVLAVINVAVMAQEKKAELPASLKGLMAFVGKWKSDATMSMDGKSYKVVYYIDFKKVAGGNGLYATEWFDSKELGSLKGSDLVGYDPYDRKIHWYTVDNMGTTHEHLGDWQSPDHFYMEHDGMRDGKKYVEKIDLVLKGKNEVGFKLVATLDGTEVQRGEGIYHKEVAAVKK